MTDLFGDAQFQSDADSETDFESLFKEKCAEDSTFYFRRIDHELLDSVSVVKFSFSFDNTVDLSCTMTVAEDLTVIEPVILNRMLTAIGLCALPWYWMGFASKRIVIEETVTTAYLNCILVLLTWIAWQINHQICIRCKESLWNNLFSPTRLISCAESS